MDESEGLDWTVTGPKLYPRFAERRLIEALADSPVVLIHGPRQCGKTTLARMVGERRGYSYISFDDDVARSSALADPVGFVGDLPERAILDEVQRVPALFTALKTAVDRHRVPGRRRLWTWPRPECHPRRIAFASPSPCVSHTIVRSFFMRSQRSDFDLPDRILPESFLGHSSESLDAAAKASWRLVERGHFDAARFLAHVGEQPRRFGYSSAIDYAEAELHIRGRQAYLLLQAERETRKLPRLRKAWEEGRVSFCNLREVAKVATPADDARWTEIAIRLPYRAVYAKVHGKPEAEAAQGRRAWPDTKLHGEIGRPDPHRQVARPINDALAELEQRVFEKHNRAAGQDTRWSEFFEAALVTYEAELDRMEQQMPGDLRRILARARYRCSVPHCTRRAELEIHHARHRSQLGGNGDSNLLPVCRHHHQAHHQELLEIAGDAVQGFRFRHRAAPGGRWVEFPPGGDAPYDPLERAWDGPSYIRETPDHIYGADPVIKTRRRLQLRRPFGPDRGLPARLE